MPPEKGIQGHAERGDGPERKGNKERTPTSEKAKTIEFPDYFAQELEAYPKAKEVFEAKPPSYRKNYLVWIMGAKTEATRQQRIERSLEWISEGKDRFWKYKK